MDVKTAFNEMWHDWSCSRPGYCRSAVTLRLSPAAFQDAVLDPRFVAAVGFTDGQDPVPIALAKYLGVHAVEIEPKPVRFTVRSWSVAPVVSS